MTDLAEQPSASFEIVEAGGKKQTWKLSIVTGAIVLEPPGGPARMIPRTDFPTAIDEDPLHMFGILAVNGEKKIMLKLPQPARDALLAWLGPPTKVDLVAALQRRYNAMSLAVGALLVVTSLPLLTDVVDWPILVWGASNFAIWGLVRVAPHRTWLLVDSVINTAVAAWFAYGMVRGERSLAWSLLLVLAYVGFNFSMKQYRRFAKLV
jgi:hypothetical protein